ncbi:hypothetical protein TCAL_16295 [Tigriopus californicus]|uniref:Uncharacterized protein n=1 Tax=Tigriopus californicus TaxID=6832 RepID=A0A553N7Y3_TIGCA|nr:hypothetical protein TCAL_16295 [Tigriopus californicus]
MCSLIRGLHYTPASLISGRGQLFQEQKKEKEQQQLKQQQQEEENMKWPTICRNCGPSRCCCTRDSGTFKISLDFISVRYPCDHDLTDYEDDEAALH